MVRETSIKNFVLPKIKPKQTLLLGMAASLAVGGMVLSQVVRNQVLQTQKTQQQVQVPQIQTVTALGRLEPSGEVIELAASSSGQGSQGSKLDKLLVKEGEEVKAGQVLAVLDNHDKLKAAYEKAKAAVGISQANLARIQAGAKTGEINAQKAEIARIQAQSLGEERAQREALARLEAQWEGDKAAQQATISRLSAELNNARSEFNRYQTLYQEGAISQSDFDSRRLKVDTLVQQRKEAKAAFERTNRTGNRQIKEAKAVLNRIQNTSSQQISSAKSTLDKIAEVRPQDVAAAKAELQQAIASKQEAKANFEQSFVKAPQDGVILKVNTRPGEKIADSGVVELGKVQEMMVVAEVYQTQIGKIKMGQNVRVTSNSLDGELKGKVDAIGWQIQRQNVINADPSENIDARVIEVRVRLDSESSQKAAKLTNLQVKAVFEL